MPFVLGIGALGLMVAPNLAYGVLATTVIGAAAGLGNVVMTTWLQQHTPPDKLGRVMSLVFYGAVALGPLGYILAGAVAEVSVNVLFA
ncbi:MAG: hypothetical protein AAF125_22500, partial [Chloroflexota bacterium]